MDISKKSCSYEEDRTCVCGSIQLLQDSANHTLAVNLQCSCAFSKSFNCTEISCASLETPTDATSTTGIDSKTSEKSSVPMPFTMKANPNTPTTPSKVHVPCSYTYLYMYQPQNLKVVKTRCHFFIKTDQ